MRAFVVIVVAITESGCGSNGLVHGPSGSALGAAGFQVGESFERVNEKLTTKTAWTSDGDRRTTTTDQIWNGRQWHIKLIVRGDQLTVISGRSRPTDGAIEDVRAIANSLCHDIAPVGTYFVAWPAPNYRRYTVPFSEALAHGALVGCHFQDTHGFAGAAASSDRVGFDVGTSVDDPKNDEIAGLQSKSIPFDWRSHPHVGDPIQLGDFRYFVGAITLSEHINENPFLQRQASPGATFIRVHYTIENTGNETVGVIAGDLLIRDSRGRVFHPSAEGTAALALEEGVDLALSQLQPGIPRDQVVAFEVPTSELERVELVIPSKSAADSETSVLPLMFDPPT